jgi:hypothetical protein
MPPPFGASLPQVFIDGAEAPEVSRNVSSVVVHVTGGRASAKLEISGPLPDADAIRVDVPATALALMLTPDEECFNGHLTAVEARMPPAASPSTLLAAVGTAPRASSGPATPLRFGVEVESGTVYRNRRGSTARCVSSTPGLLVDGWVDLTTHDPAFDGSFQMVEAWYRFDAGRGFSVEFVAKARQSR